MSEKDKIYKTIGEVAKILNLVDKKTGKTTEKEVKPSLMVLRPTTKQEEKFKFVLDRYTDYKTDSHLERNTKMITSVKDPVTGKVRRKTGKFKEIPQMKTKYPIASVDRRSGDTYTWEGNELEFDLIVSGTGLDPRDVLGDGIKQPDPTSFGNLFFRDYADRNKIGTITKKGKV